MEAKQDLIQFSLTLGSSHTSLVAARLEDTAHNFENNYSSLYGQSTSHLHVLGATRLAHNGAIKKGVVSSMEALTASILDVTDEVERQTGLNIEKVLTCIPCLAAQYDNHTENYHVKNTEIRQTDIDKMTASVLNLKAPVGFDYVHAIPGFYCVDGKGEINTPIGMRGAQMSLNFHRVMMPQSDLHNIARALYNAGLSVQNFIYEPLAAAEGALTQDEKEFGCVSISIGTYSTHVAVYLNHLPVFSKEFMVGSHHITKDLAIGLRTTQTEAERIKKELGKSHHNSLKHAYETIEIRGVEGTQTRCVAKHEITQIIEPRVYEILETVSIELKKQKLLTKATKGIVLSGGGALLNGISITAEKIFGYHTRVGHPLSISGSTEGLKSPLWSAPLGSFSPLFKPLRENEFAYDFHESSSFTKLVTKLWQSMKEPFASQSRT